MSRAVKMVLPWLAELIISGFLPERIGRIIILDWLISIEQEDN
jgi:hypothetical protein